MNTTKIKKLATKKTVKKPTHFFLRVLSRHPSVNSIRNQVLIPKLKAVYRHGSTTDGGFSHEINSIDSVRTSADKLRMKQAFDRAEVSHARWVFLSDYKNNKAAYDNFLKSIEFEKDKNSFIIAKHRMGSRGTGNTLIKTKAELDKFVKEKSSHLDNYILEEYKTYSVEYRLHITEDGCFYTCRKMLKTNTPKEQRFQRHDDNCTWILETNPKFNKPENWNEIVKDCIKALKCIGADVLAFDIKTTSIKESKDKKCKWVILESCSAPSFGNVTAQKYKLELPKIIKRKYGE